MGAKNPFEAKNDQKVAKSRWSEASTEGEIRKPPALKTQKTPLNLRKSASFRKMFRPRRACMAENGYFSLQIAMHSSRK